MTYQKTTIQSANEKRSAISANTYHLLTKKLNSAVFLIHRVDEWRNFIWQPCVFLHTQWKLYFTWRWVKTQPRRMMKTI